jgi:hypothetical protein
MFLITMPRCLSSHMTWWHQAPLYVTDKFVAYLLVGLDEEYNLVFTAIVAQVDPISPTDIYVQLLSFEQYMTL